MATVPDDPFPDPDAVITLKLTGLSPTITKDLIEGYISAKADDDVEVKSVTLLGGGNAIASVSGFIDLESFIHEKHKIKGRLVEITISEELPQLEEEDDDDTKSVRVDIIPDIIEVTGENVNADVLEMYFQGAKSGGGREKEVEWIRNFDDGVVHVKFVSTEDAAVVVAQEKHVVMRKKINIRFVPASVPKEYAKDKLLVKDIADGVDEEFFVMFVENRLGIDDGEDFTVDFRNKCAVLLFTQPYSDEEIQAMIKKLTSKKCKGHILPLERCEVNCSIIVNNITKKSLCSEEALEMYFESKHSGGRDVECVEMLGPNKAKVTFKDATVISQVLSKKHTKLGLEVSISACTALDSFDDHEDEEYEDAQENKDDTDSLSKELHNSTSPKIVEEKKVDPPPPAVHPPVTFPLDPLIAKYLHFKPAVIDSLSKEIQVSISVDDSRGTITISQTDSSPPDWPSTSTERLQYLLSKMLCRVDIVIPQSAATQLYPIIMQQCAQGGLQYAFGQGDNKVSVAGDTGQVTKLQQDVEELCSRTVQQADVIKLNSEDYAFLKGYMLPIVQKQHRSLKLKCHDLDHSLSADGSIRDVAQLKEKLPQYLVHCRAPVSLQPPAIQFLQTGKGPEILQSIVKGTKLVPFFTQPDSDTQSVMLVLLCAQDGAYQAENMAMKVADQIQLTTISLPKYFQSQVAQGPKFASQKESLCKKYTHLSVVQDGKLILVSTADILPQVSKAFSHFITEECSITANIHMKKGVWRLLHSSSMEKRWTDLVGEMRDDGVTIVSSSKPSSQKPFVKIKGEPDKVEAAKEKIQELQASVKEHELPIARPGVCQYFFNDPNGQMVLRGVENDAGVCIEMGVKDEEGDKLGVDNLSSNSQFTRVCFGNTNEMKTVSVYVGDITQFNRAEVIVNAANEDLRHSAGIAQDIVAKGGPIIATDSEEYIRKRGKLSPGSAVLFSRVGNLPIPYKAIVHTVGPRWIRKNEREIALLKRAIYSSLKQARDYNSIAIPAISSGIFGFPVDICAKALLQAVVKFSENDPGATLNEINFVVFQDNADEFLKTAKKYIENVHSFNETPVSTSGRHQPQQESRRRRRGSSKPPSTVSPTVVPTTDTVSTPPSAKSSQIPRNLSNAYRFINLTNGDILKHQEDVLVNTTDQKLGFGGYVAQVLLKAGGPGLKEECDMIQKPIPIGDIVTTGAHSLQSKHIIHVVLPSYDGANSESILRSIVQKCLHECNRLKAKSISIPSIGAGNLGYPDDVVAKCILEEAADYFSKNEGKTSLNLVHVVVFDSKVFQAFQTFYQANKGYSSTHTPRRTTDAVTTRQRDHTHTQDIPESGNEGASCFALPHDLRLEVVQGDITNESLDVIVNTTNPSLNLNGSGGVSGALSRKGGPALQSACDSMIAQGIKAGEGKVVETICSGFGQLKCKSIFHIVFEQKKFVKTFASCLERAEKMKYHSIAFPAIGTGFGNYPPAQAADAVVKALKQFTKKKPQHLKVIRMVLFQAHLHQEFTEAFKQMGESSGGFLSYLYNQGAKAFQTVGSFFGYRNEEEQGEGSGSDEDVEGQDDDWVDIRDKSAKQMLANLSLESEVILHIFGQTDHSVKRAEKKLRAIIDTQFVNDEVDNPSISTLSDEAVDELEKFAKSRQVDIDIERDPVLHFIKFHGCQSDVLQVKDKIRDAMAAIGEEKTKKEAAVAVFKHIHWMREFSDGEKEDYDELFSFEIEQAYQQKQSQYVSSDPAENFTIDFANMQETDHISGEKTKVMRVDLLEEEKPSNWDKMPVDSNGKEVHVHLVTLQADSQECKDVESRFNVTMKMGSHYSQILSIQRLQNPILYGQYIARKKEMDKRNPSGHQNELWLWHGTSPKVLNNITTQGFNRSFQGKNGVVYGQGVYFARDASYSTRYAHADDNAQKHMYLTRVLVGEYTVGDDEMVVPPPKNPNINQHILFDSTVDNQATPSIYVVYTDSQNYPAYLINYK